MAVSLTSGKHEVWVNGRKVDVSEERGANVTMIEGGGSLVVGQEQDMNRGGYNELQSMSGSIADWRIYEDFLESEAARTISSCLDSNMSNNALLNFLDLNSTWILEDIRLGFVEVNKSMCAQELSYFVIFPELRTFPETVSLCYSLGGEVAVPYSEKENEELLHLAFQYSETCPIAYSDFLWLGILHQFENQSTVHYQTKQNITYSRIIKHKIKDLETPISCGTFNGDPDDLPIWLGSWETADCLEPHCSVCQFKKPTMINMRGLCEKSYFDHEYFVSTDSKGNIEFVGSYYSVIRLEASDQDHALGYWKMSRLDKPVVSAVMKRLSLSHYPTGLNNWTVTKDICADGTILLKFTICTIDQFTCGNGDCLNLAKRCDNIFDCLEGEDEMDCHLIMFPETYFGVPGSVTSNEQLRMSFFVTILNIKSVDLAAFQFTSELKSTFEWFDDRLKFKNLRADSALVDLGSMGDQLKALWLPDFSHQDGAETASDVTSRREELYIRRLTSSVPSTIDSVIEGRVISNIRISAFYFEMILILV